MSGSIVAQVDLFGHVVGGIGIGEEFGEVALALFGAQEGPDLVVGREDRARRTEFGAHIGNHVPVHRAQGGEAGTVVLDDPVPAALHAVPAQHFENDVFGAGPRWQLAGKPHAPDLRHLQVERLARDCQGYLGAADPDCQHPQ